MLKYQICKISIDKEGQYKLYDFENNEISSTNAMNRRYRRARKNRIAEEGVSVVWILLALDTSGKEKYLQVGQSKNLTRMLSGDIGIDVGEILNKNGKFDGTKYSKLAKKYNTLVFCEVDLAKYFLEELELKMSIPTNEDLKKVYWAIKAACVEGKIAAENDCIKKEGEDCYEMWNPSPTGLDGYFFSYFKNRNCIYSKYTNN